MTMKSSLFYYYSIFLCWGVVVVSATTTTKKTVALDTYDVLFDVQPTSNQVHVTMTFAWRVNNEPHDFLKGYHSILDPTPRSNGATIDRIQVYNGGDVDQQLKSRQYRNDYGWSMVEWTFDPILNKLGQTQVIRLEYTIGNANRFLQCLGRRSSSSPSTSTSTTTLRLSAPWLNYWKSEMPPNVTYSIQFPNTNRIHDDDDDDDDEQQQQQQQVQSQGVVAASTPRVLAVHPIPRLEQPNEGTGSSSSSSHSSSGIISSTTTYQSKELWFCGGPKRCCGHDDTGICSSDPKPFWIDFQLLWDNNEQQQHKSPCDLPPSLSSSGTTEGSQVLTSLVLVVVPLVVVMIPNILFFS